MKKVNKIMSWVLLLLCTACAQSEMEEVKTASSSATPQKMTLTIKPSAATRSVLTPTTDYGFKAVWEKDDEIYALNESWRARRGTSWQENLYIQGYFNNTIVKAEQAGRRSVFQGNASEGTQVGDVLYLFYPTRKGQWSNYTKEAVHDHFPEDAEDFLVPVTLASQDGSLQGIAKYWDLKVSSAKVTEITGQEVTAEYDGDMTNLTSIQTLHFVDANGQALNNLKEVHVEGMTSVSANYNFKKSKLEYVWYSLPDVLLTSFEGNTTYLVLFPEECVLTYVVTTTDGKTYVGSSRKRTYEAGKSNDLTIKLRDMSNGVTIGGVTWGEANLYYASSAYKTQAGFISGWSLALSSEGRDLYYTQRFPYGIVGKEAHHYNLLTMPSALNENDFSTKFYSDASCLNEVAAPVDMTTSAYGDVAYWASNGQYRMPTAEEFTKLMTNSKIMLGRYGNLDGFLFYPSKTPGLVAKAHGFSRYEITTGVFLPISTKSSISAELFCWTSTVDGASDVGVLYLRYDIPSQSIAEHIIVSKPKSVDNRYYIRPVKVN